MEQIPYILLVVLWGAVALAAFFGRKKIVEDWGSLRKVLKDKVEERRADAERENEKFTELMAGAGAAIDPLLEEARNNLKSSFDLRGQENQTILSMTVTLVSMFSAFLYLSQQIFSIGGKTWIVLYLALCVLALVCLVVATIFLIESFSLTYLIPNSMEESVRKALQEKGDVSKGVKCCLIAENGVRSKVNEESTRMKSACWNVSRRYMLWGGLFLLFMLVMESLLKVKPLFGEAIL